MTVGTDHRLDELINRLKIVAAMCAPKDERVRLAIELHLSVKAGGTFDDIPRATIFQALAACTDLNVQAVMRDAWECGPIAGTVAARLCHDRITLTEATKSVAADNVKRPKPAPNTPKRQGEKQFTHADTVEEAFSAYRESSHLWGAEETMRALGFEPFEWLHDDKAFEFFCLAQRLMRNVLANYKPPHSRWVLLPAEKALMPDLKPELLKRIMGDHA